ncbi:MAG TPA: SAM-dependent methyltransferase [bacterium]|nr:SAM-dependent methyltransferase [bacterium]
MLIDPENNEHIPSLRDPAGFIFYSDNNIYRQVNQNFKENYDKLTTSGLYEKLVSEKLLIPHVEIDFEAKKNPDAYKILLPEKIKVIAYPYELCFSQLKDSAITLLDVMLISMEYGMILKDATSYNVQFHNGTPVFIDTLSFEEYKEGEPWVAYNQFCRHYIAPLCLMKYTDNRINKLLQVNLDGIPVDMSSRLLPLKSFVNNLPFTHIHLNHLFESFFSGKSKTNSASKTLKINKFGLISLLSSLKKSIKKMEMKKNNSEMWSDYYKTSNYSDTELGVKKVIVKKFLDIIKSDISSALDIGSNTGIFSRLAAESGVFTASIDNDVNCSEQNYLISKSQNIKNILPLNFDLINLYSRTGWAGKEHLSLIDRFKPDLCIALAIIHHLRITSGIPLVLLSDFFQKNSKYLIIEFIPKSDKQILTMLSNRKDIYYDYSQLTFETVFNRHFKILLSEPVGGSGRTLYLMQKRF